MVPNCSYNVIKSSSLVVRGRFFTNTLYVGRSAPLCVCVCVCVSLHKMFFHFYCVVCLSFMCANNVTRFFFFLLFMLILAPTKQKKKKENKKLINLQINISKQNIPKQLHKKKRQVNWCVFFF